MASNFKIEVKGVKGGMSAGSRPSGVGSDVSAIRQKAIQAQKNTEKNSNVSMSAMKDLTSTMKALIQSNKSLIEHLKRSAASGGGGGEGGPKGGASRSLASNAAGAMGGGALLALLGFALSKSNMIGQAYISTAAEQSKNVGMGGFRTGRGMYTGSEIGSGMKSYSSSSGRFANNASVNGSAIQVGNIFGLSADEALGQAGKFDRAGANYTNAVNSGAGAGIQTQLPMFISAIGDQLEESVAAGIDTSTMSKSISEDMAALTAATKNQDVRTAMAFVNAMKGVKEAGGKGQITNIDQLMAYKAAQSKVLSSVNQEGPKGGMAIEDMLKKGDISSEAAEKLRAMRGSGKTITEADFNNVSNGGLGFAVSGRMQRQSEQTTLEDVASGYLNLYKGAGSKQAQLNGAFSLAQSSGSQLSRQMLESVMGLGDARAGLDKDKGASLIGAKDDQVTGSASGISVSLINAQTNLLLKHGDAFASATVKATKSLLELADNVATATEKIINHVSKDPVLQTAAKVGKAVWEYSSGQTIYNAVSGGQKAKADDKKNIK
jgi:hypothetical protein